MGMKFPSVEEVVPYVFYSVLYLAFCLRPVRIRGSYVYAVVIHKVLERYVESIFRGIELPFNDHLLHVVIEYWGIVTAELCECVFMKPNEVVHSYFRGEFCLYHPGVSKHIGEAVELPGYSILFYCTETSKIDLCRFPV